MHISFEKINSQWLEVLSISTIQLANCMTNEPRVNYPSKFYWKIIGGLSKRMKSQSLDSLILKEFCQIYKKFHSILESKRSDADIEAYLCLIEELRKTLICQRTDVNDKMVTFDTIVKLVQENDRDKKIADNFGFKNAVADKKTLENAKQEFISCHKRISQLLIKARPGKNW